MHPYSLDNQVRKWTYVTIAIISISVPYCFETLMTFLGFQVISFSISFGAIFGSLFLLVDKFLWKISNRTNLIPNLEGEWQATGISSFQDEDENNHKFCMEIYIKQTFTNLEVFTETQDSTSKSTMANIEMNHPKPIFRYTFENTPKNMSDNELQRHPGMMQLRINSNSEMSGDYFSGKHRLRYGELTLTKVSK